MPMQDGKWYKTNVPIPADLTPVEAEQFIEDLARGLSRADPKMKARASQPVDYSAPAGETAVALDGVKPLFFCHNK